MLILPSYPLNQHEQSPMEKKVLSCPTQYNHNSPVCEAVCGKLHLAGEVLCPPVRLVCWQGELMRWLARKECRVFLRELSEGIQTSYVIYLGGFKRKVANLGTLKKEKLPNFATFLYLSL